MDYAKESLRLHYEWKGKLEMTPRAAVDSKDALSLAYTPGVAQPCLEIQKDVSKSYELTRRWNTVAVVTDGSAVLGLGDIGPEAGMPVMEGKCVLFKAFGGVDAIPLCVRSQDVDEIVNTVALLAGSFGGVNLEDIAAPRCFEIERKLKERCDIPIFHDDQHGTAVITLAGLTNALKVVGKRLEEVRIVINGAGAAAVSITKLLLSAGAEDVTLCDRKGAIYEGRADGMNWIKEEMAQVTNRTKRTGMPGGRAGGGRCVHRRIRPRRGHHRDGADHGPGRHHLRLRQPHARDLPRRRQGRRCGGGGHRPQRLSQPDQQRAGLPRHLPGRAGRPGQRHQRRHEDRRRPRAGGSGGRRPLRRLHHPRRLRSPGAGRGGHRCGAGRPRFRRGPGVTVFTACFGSAFANLSRFV